ncbi:DUF1254 domain-containing protein [Endozoicomonas numazuensis]|uniref:DUF1254 domain-containing protein n=1 Tax=Endozoicomonas numazuensis TaxID=1137799 RepID=A0A081NMQ6_9GAMM|nr:DUF1214 domain-containing protein [Endozoicomonas numazuensis]KEQ19729.1 hypothetical protein GZ78_07615 [Endozoicomonas numazuensis]
MKKVSILLAVAVLLGVAVSQINLASFISYQQKRSDAIIAEKMAASIGTLAYVYGYPLVDMAAQMHNETHLVKAEQQVYAPINRLHRFDEIVGPDNAGNLRLPNNDTLYFSGWFDIRNEPVIIHTPDTQGRYFTIAVTNLYSEVTHIGRRTFGTDEAYYALVSPDWQGTLPEGITPIEVESTTGWLLGRMYVAGKNDKPAAVDAMNNIWMAALSEFTPGQKPATPTPANSDPIDPLKSIEFFSYMNKALRTLPTRASEQALMAQFDLIGIGPNSHFDPEQLSEATLKGLEQALEEGINIVEASELRTLPSYNGWMIPQKVGRYGFDYIQRASVVANGYGNLPEESTYAATLTSGDDDIMTGSNTYKLHFEKGQLPPVKGFWSVATYELPKKQLASNEINRYSIGDRTPGIHFNDDGSLTIWLQSEKPEDPNKNWLPVPEGIFMAVMRMYEPEQAILDKEYQLARIERVK